MSPVYSKDPRILIVTPEVTYLPKGMGNMADGLTAKAGGLADVSAALISALFSQGTDVHVALPDYRAIFNVPFAPLLRRELDTIKSSMPEDRIHLAEDRVFFYRDCVYSNYEEENSKIALAFQREILNNIILKVRPDLIHCNDWMTGLIPAMARQLGIPCLFTIHNIHSDKNTLSYIEDRGIDAAAFWQHLFYERMPLHYEETRETNRVDSLVSGVFAAHYVNTVSHTFLMEVVEGRHKFMDGLLTRELANKWRAGCAVGILNSPDPSFNPVTDKAQCCRYGPHDHMRAKKENKLFLQKAMGLIQDPEAPVFFWPSRLDRIQKGCQLLADILYDVITAYWGRNLQIVFVASGEFFNHFKSIVDKHGFHERVSMSNFDEKLSRMAYGASDFVLMPSAFEPCGLPQMIGPIYGCLPVAHDTGGIHDTVTDMDVEHDTGNGFLFNTFVPDGLLWAIQQAMKFYDLPEPVKRRQVERIMTESISKFNYSVTAKQYIALYEKMLQRPLRVAS